MPVRDPSPPSPEREPLWLRWTREVTSVAALACFFVLLVVEAVCGCAPDEDEWSCD